MIHDTLINLFCTPENADLVQWSNLDAMQEFLHPGEKKLLDRIMDVVREYHKIMAFLKSIENYPNRPKVSAESEQTNLRGLYVRAFGHGIQKSLQDYNAELVALESKFLDNPELPLTYILSSVEKYKTQFNDINLLIESIQKEKLHGCVIMDKLMKFSLSTKSFNKIILSLNSQFYFQLSNWIVHGDVIDVYDEFFIVDEKCPDTDFLYTDQLTETDSQTSILWKNETRHPPIVRKYSINWNLVPIFIDEDTAESILFMGRILWIINNDPKGLSENLDKRNAWGSRNIEYCRKIQALENQCFNNFEFQNLMEECRLKITRYLWSLMLEEGNLKEHLQLIRDYFALGRGELFQEFMILAKTYLGHPSENVEQNLNSIFFETARNLYGKNDKTEQKFWIGMKNCESSGTNSWSKVQLNFEIKWPLHIVFHPEAMKLYNLLFSFLLRLKYEQLSINKVWTQQVAGKMKIDPRVWKLRNNLMFLINNFQYYLQVDVIEAHFSILMKAVDTAHEFEDIVKLHHEFITNLLSKSFLLNYDCDKSTTHKRRLFQAPTAHVEVPCKVHQIILQLFELNSQFCLFASSWEETLAEPEVIQLEEFQSKCNDIVDALLFNLHNLLEKANGGHLIQLINQLDFNNYYTKNSDVL